MGPGDYLWDFLSHPEWVTIAKWFLTVLFFACSAVCIYVTWHFQRWHEQLVRMERTAMFDRDEAMFIFTSMRARLAEIRARIRPMPDNDSLMDGVRTAIDMLVKRQRNPFQWGMLGLKMARTAWKALKNK